MNLWAIMVSTTIWSTLDTFSEPTLKTLSGSVPGFTHAITAVLAVQYDPETAFYISIGYFWYELVFAVYRRNLQSGVHGLVCFLTYYYILSTGNYYDLGHGLLLLECSTPHYHLWKLHRRKRTNERFYLNTFRTLFFVLRVLYLNFLVAIIAISHIHPVATCTAILFSILNVTWFYNLCKVKPHKAHCA